MRVLMEELELAEFDTATDCVDYWDTYDVMTKEQEKLRKDGANPVPDQWKKPEEQGWMRDIKAALSAEDRSTRQNSNSFVRGIVGGFVTFGLSAAIVGLAVYLKQKL